MTRIRFEDLPSRKTPKNAENLNKLNNVIISSTEPTTGEEVWIQTGDNIFNPNTDIEFTDGYRKRDNATEKYSDENYYGLKIEVEPNTTYTSYSDIDYSLWHNLVFFDSNMNVLSYDAYNTSNKTFTTPNNCVFVTIAVHKGYSWFVLEKGTTMVKRVVYTKKRDESYEELLDIQESTIKVSSKEPARKEKVLFRKTTNIFKEIWENGCLNSSNGTDEANSGRIRTYYIEVLPNTTYSLSLVAARLVEYNQNGGFVKSHFGISKLTTNSNTKYIRFSITSTDAHDEVMVNEGNEVLPYEKYVEPAIYTRNDNEIYEEFIPTNIQKYSTREPIKIGKWINGKDLYIHTVYIPSLPNASTGFYDLGIDKSIIDEVWIDESNSYFKAVSTDGANTEVFPMNYTYSSTNYLMTNIRNKQIRIITTDNKSGTYGYITYKFTRNDE